MFEALLARWTRRHSLFVAVFLTLAFGLGLAVPGSATAHEDDSAVATPDLIEQPDYQAAIYQTRGVWHGTKIFADWRRETTQVSFKCTATGVDNIGTLLTNAHCGDSPQHGEQIIRNGGLEYGAMSGMDGPSFPTPIPSSDAAPTSAAPATNPDAYVLTDLVLTMEVRQSPFDRKTRSGTPPFNDTRGEDEGWIPVKALTSGTLSGLDLALFRIPNVQNMPFLELSDAKPQVNDNMHVAGYPADDMALTTTSSPSAGSRYQVTTTDGTVNRYTFEGPDLIETDARILPGQSGSPAVDRISHKLDGIVTRSPDPAMYGYQSNTLTYLVHVDTIREFLSANSIIASKFDASLQSQFSAQSQGIQRLSDESTYIPWWFVALLAVLLFLAFLAWIFRTMIEQWIARYNAQRKQESVPALAPAPSPCPRPVVVNCPFGEQSSDAQHSDQPG